MRGNKRQAKQFSRKKRKKYFDLDKMTKAQLNDAIRKQQIKIEKQSISYYKRNQRTMKCKQNNTTK